MQEHDAMSLPRALDGIRVVDLSRLDHPLQSLGVAVAADRQRRTRELKQANERIHRRGLAIMSWMMPVCFWSPEWW